MVAEDSFEVGINIVWRLGVRDGGFVVVEAEAWRVLTQGGCEGQGIWLYTYHMGSSRHRYIMAKSTSMAIPKFRTGASAAILCKSQRLTTSYIT